MKKILFLLVALTATLCVNAERCSILKVGKYWNNQYELISITDTTLTVVEMKDSVTVTYPAKNLVEVFLPERKLRYYSFNGKLVTEAEMQTARLQADEAERKRYDIMRANNPNYAVGQAMRGVAKGSLLIGIPSLITGTILLGYGLGMQKNHPLSRDSEKYADCATAGMVLFPIGASLTIVGIPLSLEGKELMRLNINYTGNGAGIALAW